MLQLTKPLAFIDLETTGVNLGTDRIVEIAIVKILPDGSQTTKRKLINPGMPIPKASSDLHGITDEMVKDEPVFKQIAHELKQILDGCDLVISPDTGPLHLAGALGKPVIGLYGYNSPARVGPWRQDPRLLLDAFHEPGETPQMTFAHRPGRMDQISVADVLARVKIWSAGQKR